MHPTLVRLGPIDIRYYGLMYVIAISAGIFLFQREIPRKKIALTKDEVISYVFWLVIGGILGARIYYVLFMWKQFYAQNPLEILGRARSRRRPASGPGTEDWRSTAESSEGPSRSSSTRRARRSISSISWTRRRQYSPLDRPSGDSGTS